MRPNAATSLFRKRAKFLYYLSRCLQILPLRYSKNLQQVELLQVNARCERVWHRLRWLLICLFLCYNLKNIVFIVSLITAIDVRSWDRGAGQKLIIFLLIVTVRSTYLLQLWRMRRRCVASARAVLQLLNDVLQLQRTVCQLTGSALQLPNDCGYHLMLRLKLLLLIIHFLFSWRSFVIFEHFFYCCFELCYYAHETLQLILLSLWTQLNVYIAARQVGKSCRTTSQRRCMHQRRRLLQALLLQRRVRLLHDTSTTLWRWFPFAVYLCIFSAVYNMSQFIRYGLFREGRILVKLYLTLRGVLSGFGLPWLNMYGMGAINDALQNALQRSVNLYMMVALCCQTPGDVDACASCVALQRWLDLEVLSLKSRPYAVRMFGELPLTRELALSFMVLTITQALSVVYYELTLRHPNVETFSKVAAKSAHK